MQLRPNRSVRPPLRLPAWLILVAVLVFGWPAAAEPVYTLGVTPQFDQKSLFAAWRPIIAELERRSGLRLKLVSAVTVPDFEKAVQAAAFDFAYVNPYLLYHDGERVGYVPLLRDERPLHGIIVVLKESPLQALADLEGKPLAVPAFNALAGSLMIQADLTRAGVRVKPVEMKTHSGVYAAVAQKQAEAGGGADRTLEEQPAAIRDALRVFHVSTAVPALPVVAHRRVPDSARRRLTNTWLTLGDDPAGRALLAGIPMTQPIAATWSDYRGLAALGLDRYWRAQGE